ncbi:MATE family efflux transporter [Dubosiella muris]|uniref:Uncharacterized protein n=1 Tax=Dubosiella muris TaxID=3038133 RepID=A0AC61R4N9_9FIRM|nr:MATE family efflux transporter [Dubosiella muris]TGY64946.1 hypothetical protein E5336_10890 [Dubosiella muris]
MQSMIFDSNHPVREYFKLSLPVVLSMLVSLIYNLADTFFIGRTNNADLVAGVSLCVPVFTLLMAFGNIYGQGGNSLISRALGKQNHDLVRHISSFCFWGALLTGVGLTFVGLVFSKPILMSLGAQGAAIATVLGYVATDLYFLYVLRKKSSLLSLRWKAQADKKEILGIGASAAITNITQSVCIILMNQCLLPYGSEQIAAMGIVLKVTMIVQLLLTEFAFGGAPLYGYLFGSQNFGTLKKLIRFCALWMGGLALALSLPLFCFPKALLSVFIQVNTVIEAGATMLRWQCAGMVFGGLVLFFTVLFQTTGKMAPSYILSLSRQGIVFVVVLFVLKSAFGYSGILASQAVADWFSAAIALGLYRSVFVRSSQTLSLEK